MVCEQMLHKFDEFDSNEHFIVAPEALNRSYRQMFKGEPLASWMTSRDRLYEIEDYSNYLEEVVHDLKTKMPFGSKLIVLGFSQGGMTMFRWLHAKDPYIDFYIAYACWIPDDIDLRHNNCLQNTPGVYTYGTEDRFLTRDRVEILKQRNKDQQLDLAILSYHGEHKVDRAQLKTIFERYIKAL